MAEGSVSRSLGFSSDGGQQRQAGGGGGGGGVGGGGVVTSGMVRAGGGDEGKASDRETMAMSWRQPASLVLPSTGPRQASSSTTRCLACLSQNTGMSLIRLTKALFEGIRLQLSPASFSSSNTIDDKEYLLSPLSRRRTGKIHSRYVEVA